MGYRFILRRLEYPHVVHRGQMMPVHMWRLKRRGSAGVSRIHAEPTRLAKTRKTRSDSVTKIVKPSNRMIPFML